MKKTKSVKKAAIKKTVIKKAVIEEAVEEAVKKVRGLRKCLKCGAGLRYRSYNLWDCDRCNKLYNENYDGSLTEVKSLLETLKNTNK